MKPVTRAEILDLGEYETIRDRFRARVIEEKKRRRGRLGDRMSFVFENHDTALLQIQEMLRTERITREAAVLHEIDTYNELVPGDRELSATFMIEIDDKAERDDFLVRAAGLERAIALVCDGERSPAVVEASRLLDGRASAVIYARFALSPAARDKIARGAAALSLVVDHPAYRAEAALPSAVARSLAEDLA
jgi:hypothetical protein